MIGRALIFAVVMWMGPAPLAMAQDEAAPLPDLRTCLARAVAHFETELWRSTFMQRASEFEIVTRDRIAHCGVLGIVRCDRSDAPLACQDALRDDLLTIRAQVLDALPVPDAVAGRDPVWSDGLYPRFHAIVHGQGAGPTCAGADEIYQTWCEARQAGLRLAEAVMVWQVARVLDAASPAVEAGWVDTPPQPEPVWRPGRDQ